MSNKKKKIQASPIRKNKNIFLFIGVLLAITFVSYYPSVKNDFIRNWDDHEYVINNVDIRDLSATGIKKMFTSYYIGNYQPLTMLSYAIDYKLAMNDKSPGLSPFVFHTTNLILHLLSTFLVFMFIIKLTGKKEVALASTLFFALHPSHAESVAWIAERKDVLFGFLFIASLYFYTKFAYEGNKMKHYYICMLLFILSCLSKSAAITLPFVLVLIDYYKNGRLSIKGQSNKIPFFLLSLAFGLVALASQKSAGATTMAPYFPMFERFFLICYSVVFYIVKSIAPIGLSAMYYYPKGELPFYFYLSPLIIIAIVWGIHRSGQFKKELIFGSLFFFTSILLIIQLVPLGRTITADRYTYIPYIGIGFILGQLYVYIKESKLHLGDYIKNILFYSFFIYAVLFSYMTMQRSALWKDSITLFTDVIAKNPKQSHPYLVRAAAEMDMSEFKLALADFNKGIELDPLYAEAWNNRGNVYFNLKDYNSAIKDYTKAIELDRKYQLPFNNRGSCKRNQGDYAGALEDFSRAVEIDTNFFVAFHNRGLTKYYMKDYSGALQDYDRTIKLKPDYPDAYSNRGVAKYFLQDYKGALPDYDKAIQLNPNYGEAYSNRAAVKFYTNDRKGACDDWQKALQTGYSSATQMIETYCK